MPPLSSPFTNPFSSSSSSSSKTPTPRQPTTPIHSHTRTVSSPSAYSLFSNTTSSKPTHTRTRSSALDTLKLISKALPPKVASSTLKAASSSRRARPPALLAQNKLAGPPCLPELTQMSAISLSVEWDDINASAHTATNLTTPSPYVKATPVAPLRDPFSTPTSNGPSLLFPLSPTSSPPSPSPSLDNLPSLPRLPYLSPTPLDDFTKPFPYSSRLKELVSRIRSVGFDTAEAEMTATYEGIDEIEQEERDWDVRRKRWLASKRIGASSTPTRTGSEDDGWGELETIEESDGGEESDAQTADLRRVRTPFRATTPRARSEGEWREQQCTPTGRNGREVRGRLLAC